MRTALPKQTPPTRSHRPRAVTVFAAAFVAGAAAAVGVNRTLDVRLAQSKPRVESEAIFVALRSLPQGSPVTVWDVALRDWPKAMMPATALRASDTFSGHVLKHPLREGQPLLSIQLAPAAQGNQPAAEPSVFPPPAAYTQTSKPAVPADEGDLWSPAESVKAPSLSPTAQSPAQAVSQAAPASTHQVAVVPPESTPAPAGPAVTAQTTETAQRHPTAAAEAPAVETTTTTEVTTTDTVVQGLAQSTAATNDRAAASEGIDIPDVSSAADSVAAATADPVVATGAAPTAEPRATQAADSQPQAIAADPNVPTPTTTASSDGAAPEAPAPEATTAASDVLQPVVAAPVQSIPPTAATTTLPTQPSPVARPRPAHSRFLVVPESIAVQADASFAARAATPQQTAALPPTAPPAASRSASNAVRPLPLPTTTERVGQARPQGGSQASPQNNPQARPPQRHGRQAQPANPGTPANAPPQPRLGAAMFPNISAGIGAIEGRIRREPTTQDAVPTTVPARSLMSR